MTIHRFMRGYKAAWEQRDEAMSAAHFTADGEYSNMPFAVQRGPAQPAEYWRRVKIQEDVHVSYEVPASTAESGIAHWHVTYQVALPRMVLDGALKAEFESGGLSRKCQYGGRACRRSLEASP